MVSTAPKSASEIELELPLNDPRFTPLVHRLATEYWQIVQRNAERIDFPILRAWVDVDVDMEDVTWFPFTVHSPVTHDEAWAFQCSISAEAQRWIDQLDPAAQLARELVALGIVGVKDRQRARNGS